MIIIIPRLLGAWQCPTLTWRMPHYHRRYSVSLLCSAWVQVVPLRYRRQANSLIWISLIRSAYRNKRQNFLGVVWLSLTGN